jgi:hypothetical protein
VNLTPLREARGRISLLPRWIHQTYAFVAGYFWLPCPVCGRQVGGHEWRSVNGKPASIPRGGPGIRRGICPVCAYEGRGNEPEPCSDGLGRLYPFPHWHPHNGKGLCVRCGQAVDPARQPVAHGYEARPVAVDPLPRPLSEHCRPGRCLALTCCSYECSQGRCPSIPAEHRKETP